ncbi:RusA family crossover junction endodeoxyribonuclease [Methylobacterium sp. Leaf399]|uniref:RusA family crossover junction endodeoxyribonuclease n=1 Tax=Methylobacterium sp. Leaf399 TaxID=1736364 RepID=UPI0009E7A3F5|nr:RusA family crossover junction endodeoxyribonuclease [Methylobacterium sp. Leaf399]
MADDHAGRRNLLKVLDALNEVVWRDDKQIAKAAIEKRYGAKPELVIQIEELAPVASSTVHFPGLAAPGIAV